jgi:hypothetical protein
MTQQSSFVELRSSDEIGTLRRCLWHAFRAEADDSYDELLAAIDAADASRCTIQLRRHTRSGTPNVLESLRALARGEIMVVADLAETGPTLIWLDQMMPLMLVACPSFRDHWDAFYKEDMEQWSGADQSFPETLYLHLAVHDLALHLVRKLECGQTAEFENVFKVVERWIVEGSETARAVAIKGFLEDLLLPHFYLANGPTNLLRWVGPRTYKWWVDAGSFWDRLAATKIRPEQF